MILAALLALPILLLSGTQAAFSHAEADCDTGNAAWNAAVSYDVGNDECDLNSAVTQNGTVILSHTLHIGPVGKITTNAGPGPATGGLTLIITDHDGPGGGSLIIDTPSGATGTNGISGNVAGPGFGKPITVTTSGDVTLHGNGTKGAAITSSRSVGGSGGGGNITIDAGQPCGTTPSGDIFMAPGSVVQANTSNGPAGEIEMNACKDISMDGLVESTSGQSGAGDSRGGGPIDLVAGCNLLISDTGVVSSRSNDPRGERIHLEGCEVTIYGLVESVAKGHHRPHLPNSCKATADPMDDDRPDKPNGVPLPNYPYTGVYSTSCVEVWGQNILIDATGTHNGEVSADSGGGGNAGTGWVDLYAFDNLTLIGDTSGAFAVHANGLGGSGDDGEEGGLIVAKAKNGVVTSSGRALAAFAGNQGSNSDGGSINVEADGNVALGNSIADSGARNLRGIIFVKSHDGQVTGNAPGLLDTCGGTQGAETGGTDNACDPAAAASPRLVTLQGCGPPGVVYTGTTDPSPFTNPGDSCGTDPSIPTYVVFDTERWDNCRPPATKSGTKFHDLNADGDQDVGELGLSGWVINAYADNGDGDLSGAEFAAGAAATDTTDVNGDYSLTLIPGSYIVCEVLQATWFQSAPIGTQCDGNAGLGAAGYAITLASGQNEPDNDFGNFQRATKSGTKFEDENADGDQDGGELGLSGWVINAYADNGDGDLSGPEFAAGAAATDTTDVNGDYSLTLNPGSYVVCEVLQPDWTQSAPSGAPSECDADPSLGSEGYAITLISGQSEPDNDFGNFTRSFCEKGSVRDELNPVTGRFPGNEGPDKIVELDDGPPSNNVQLAIDTATDVNDDGYIIIGVRKNGTDDQGGDTNQEIVIDDNRSLPFALLACSVDFHDPVPATPVVTITGNNQNLVYVHDVHAHGGSNGYYITGNNFAPAGSAKGVIVANSRAMNNSQHGYLIEDDRVQVENAPEIDDNALDGVHVKGNNNQIGDANTINGNNRHGVFVEGNNNVIVKNRVGRNEGNSQDGINVVGTGNDIVENDVNRNLGDGIEVSGGTGASAATVNEVKKNDVGTEAGNLGHGINIHDDTGNGTNNPIEVDENNVENNGLNGVFIASGINHELEDNESNDNGGCEYLVAAGNQDGGNNDFGSFTVAGPSFPTACQED